MKLLLCALFAILVSLATARNVYINGVCVDCFSPEAETSFVGERVYISRPEGGTLYINGGQGYSTGLGGGAGGPSVVPTGYSGSVGDSYDPNTDC